MVVKVKSGFPVLVIGAGCLHVTNVGSVIKPSSGLQRRRQLAQQLAHTADRGGRAKQMSDGWRSDLPQGFRQPYLRAN
jgi:hypothetical protein